MDLGPFAADVALACLAQCLPGTAAPSHPDKPYCSEAWLAKLTIAEAEAGRREVAFTGLGRCLSANPRIPPWRVRAEAQERWLNKCDEINSKF